MSFHFVHSAVQVFSNAFLIGVSLKMLQARKGINTRREANTPQLNYTQRPITKVDQQLIKCRR